jgi:hypothetical protein
MQLYAVVGPGRTITLDVEVKDSVEDLKAKIHDETDIPPAYQQLLFAGKSLENGHTLLDYNIQHESRMRVVTCIPGNGTGASWTASAASTPPR